MRLAFDLDDTLIPTIQPFAVEPPRWRCWGWLCGVERLRLGTAELLDWLRGRGIEVWVYTTSLRSPGHIRRTLGCYGVRLGGVVNGDLHAAKARNWMPPFSQSSKYPPAFNIDVLVDDSEGVRLEGERYNFQVVHVRPDDADWINTVKRELA